VYDINSQNSKIVSAIIGIVPLFNCLFSDLRKRPSSIHVSNHILNEYKENSVGNGNEQTNTIKNI
jgi:hypothetical protein